MCVPGGAVESHWVRTGKTTETLWCYSRPSAKNASDCVETYSSEHKIVKSALYKLPQVSHVLLLA